MLQQAFSSYQQQSYWSKGYASGQLISLIKTDSSPVSPLPSLPFPSLLSSEWECRLGSVRIRSGNTTTNMFIHLLTGMTLHVTGAALVLSLRFRPGPSCWTLYSPDLSSSCTLWLVFWSSIFSHSLIFLLSLWCFCGDACCSLWRPCQGARRLPNICIT